MMRLLNSANNILVITNSTIGLYKFRIELIEELLKRRFKVIISVPKDDFFEEFERRGVSLINTSVDRRGTNPLKDILLLWHYYKIIKKNKPKVVLLYTAKPNIYGGIACQILEVPYISNITGLGSAFESKTLLLPKLMFLLYKFALRRAFCVFFQNEQNLNVFERKRIVIGKRQLIPGSGVNLNYYALQPYPESKDTEFAFIARVMKAKGIEEYLHAAKVIRKEFPNVVFHICGDLEEDYSKEINMLIDSGDIIFHGMVDDTREIYKRVHCVVNPSSYYEGMSNVLLEAASSGRPVIASLIPGCKETFQEGITGFGIKPQSKDSLVEVIKKFVLLPWDIKKEMGIRGREFVSRNFDRQRVINAYLEQIEMLK